MRMAAHVPVCASVSVREHISETLQSNFHQVFRPGSVPSSVGVATRYVLSVSSTTSRLNITATNRRSDLI